MVSAGVQGGGGGKIAGGEDGHGGGGFETDHGALHALCGQRS